MSIQNSCFNTIAWRTQETKSECIFGHIRHSHPLSLSRDVCVIYLKDEAQRNFNFTRKALRDSDIREEKIIFRLIRLVAHYR